MHAGTAHRPLKAAAQQHSTHTSLVCDHANIMNRYDETFADTSAFIPMQLGYRCRNVVTDKVPTSSSSVNGTIVNAMAHAA